MEAVYEGPERRKSVVVQDGVLKVWHFIVAQISLFVTLLTFMFIFGSWGLSQLQQNFYPASKGVILEQMIDKLNSNLETQNLILTELRIFIARNVRNLGGTNETIR